MPSDKGNWTDSGGFSEWSSLYLWSGTPAKFNRIRGAIIRLARAETRSLQVLEPLLNNVISKGNVEAIIFPNSRSCYDAIFAPMSRRYRVRRWLIRRAEAASCSKSVLQKRWFWRSGRLKFAPSVMRLFSCRHGSNPHDWMSLGVLCCFETCSTLCLRVSAKKTWKWAEFHIYAYRRGFARADEIVSRGT